MRPPHVLSDGMEEREGFEPSEREFSRFQDERDRPLRHLSNRDVHTWRVLTPTTLLLAGGAGIEPVTCGFGGRCSA